MGVITQYVIDLSELGLSVSNNVYRGDFIVDAEITAEMVCGWPGSAFEVKIFDLPEAKLKAIKQALERRRFTPIKLQLGYLDLPSGTVMEGLVDSLKIEAEESKLVATLRGLETATAALRHTEVELTLDAGLSVEAAVGRLLNGRTFSRGSVSLPPVVQGASGTLRGRALRGRLLDLLDELAREAEVELLVMDGKVYLGQPVKRTDYTPAPKLHPDENLAVFTPFKESLPEEKPPFELEPFPATDAEGFHFVATGDHKLRPGHAVVAKVRDYDALAGADFRIASLVHKLTLQGGYTCTGYALKACEDRNCRRRRSALPLQRADDIARRLTTRVDQAQRRRPFVEVGKVKRHQPGGGSGSARHRTSLYFGQNARAIETQPSVHAPIETNEEQVFADKPLVAPFAWNRCGLVVPVYPGMKAALLHNQGLHDDVLIGGFLWSDDPSFEPPQSREGDYWLCLPVDFDSSQPPSASTKAVNDLSANNGRRVIEAKGLRIAIGAGLLGNAGARPTEGADDELVIEHSSGTKLTIAADGTLKFEASKVEIKGDVSINGSVDIT